MRLRSSVGVAVAAAARIRPLALELPYAAGGALKGGEKKGISRDDHLLATWCPVPQAKPFPPSLCLKVHCSVSSVL